MMREPLFNNKKLELSIFVKKALSEYKLNWWSNVIDPWIQLKHYSSYWSIDSTRRGPQYPPVDICAACSRRSVSEDNSWKGEQETTSKGVGVWRGCEGNPPFFRFCSLHPPFRATRHALSEHLELVNLCVDPLTWPSIPFTDPSTL